MRAGGRLVASRSACGPAPILGLGPAQPDPNQVALTKTDFVTPAGEYRLLIEGSGGSHVVSYPAATGSTLVLQTSALYDGLNHLRLRAEAECGLTEYGNAVTVVVPGHARIGDPSPAPAACTFARLDVT